MTTVRPKTGYLKTLDGWRAVAILSVMLYHDSLHSLGPINDGWLFEFGGKGVDLFFSISGLLICWRLMEEEEKFGFISLKNFYVRRAFRILPPAMLFLVAVAVLGVTHVLDIGRGEWLGAAFFYRNYTFLLGAIHAGRYFTGHFWSLSVEEHFYLLLPGILILARKRFRLPLLAGLAVLLEIWRFAVLVLRHRQWDTVMFHTDMRLNALLLPAMLAILVHQYGMRDQLQRWLRWWPALFVLTLLVIRFGGDTYWETTLEAMLLPLVTLGGVLNPENAVGRVLEWAPLRFVGRISYSLYLWQQLFLVAHYLPGPAPLGFLETTPIRYALPFVCAMASYYLLERPMIKVGHRLAPPATLGREAAM